LYHLFYYDSSIHVWNIDITAGKALEPGYRGPPAGDGAQDVQWTSALRRPERSGDLEPGFKVAPALEKDPDI